MDILFWSGGKDSYLAHESYWQKYPKNDIRLLTTFEEKSKRVPHQNIPIGIIKKQAKALNLPLNLIPLPTDCPNNIYTAKVHEALKNQGKAVQNLVFGDWYLQDIRDWREQQFTESGYKCRFPIWEKPLNELWTMLLLKPVKIRISAVAEEYQKFISVGEIFDQNFIRQLPDDIDPMGEKGEFHTQVVFKSFEK
jgi:diphthamide synthase (EF-2-diphthine--ammonia ligase)